MKRRAVLTLPLAMLAPSLPETPKHYNGLRLYRAGHRTLSQGEGITLLATFKKNFPELRGWAKHAAHLDEANYLTTS
jgi:hypothetical protein